ncbi:hypothetical protein AB1Y20_017316 [Prymnesium parvum]|uniref:PDZ domain-containing protein n=1 Tax=Prymnesium parvum TaxID=97485 RepID=A0AB34JNZ8_PRYPA
MAPPPSPPPRRAPRGERAHGRGVLLLLLLALGGASSLTPRFSPRRSAAPAGRKSARPAGTSPRPALPPAQRLTGSEAPRFRLPKLQPERLSQLAPRLPEKLQELASSVRPLQVLSGFALALVLTFGTLFAGGKAINSFLAEDNNGEVLERALLFGAILENVKAAYVDTNVDIDKLFQTGVNAMLSTLDPYSEYEDAKESEDLTLRTTGRYGGVGLTIGSSEGSKVLVLGALEGFAFDAGVRAGDQIVQIDGMPLQGKSVEEVKNLLRGEPGTVVTLTLRRDGSPLPEIKLDVPRKLVRLPDVTLAAMIDRGVGYIRLDGFSEGTAAEVAFAIARMQAVGLDSLILDMRDNPGGLLNAAISVSQQLVPEGTEIVSTAGRVYSEGTSISYRSNRPPLLQPSVKLAVLVNPNTASAAEIVSGVVQDTDRGVIIGERTYGKGLVQVVEPLPGGAALKLTVARYYTPSGRCIQATAYDGGRVEATAARPAAPADGSVGEAPSAPAPTPPPAAPPLPGDEVPGRSRAAYLPRKLTAAEQAVYHTANGRVVSGGGGIAPDVEVKPRPVRDLERSLLQQGYFYSFASDWLGRHRGEPEQQVLQVTRDEDQVYQEFVRFVREQQTGQGGGRKLAKLIDVSLASSKLAEVEKALSAETSAAARQQVRQQVEQLRKLLLEQQLAQLDSQRQAIQQEVREAVLGRLTSPSRRIFEQLQSDPQVLAALDVVTNDERYDALLRPAATPTDAAAAETKG